MDIKEIFKNMHVETRAFINGAYVESQSGEKIVKCSSFDGMALPEITACGKPEVEKAVLCAKAAYEAGVWRNLPPGQKKEVLLDLAKLMEENRQELAVLDTVETSRAYKNYYEDSIPKAIQAVRYFAEAVDKIYDCAVPPREHAFATVTRCPLGVVGIITPWNDPMVVAAWKFAPALLMGNSVILKPAEQSSLSMIKTAMLALEAGIPNGVFQVLPGYGEQTGRELALHKDVRGIFFTGSSETGKKVMQYAGMSNLKKVGLECGGKSPFLVSQNCKDLKKAASVLAENVFYNQGQICSAPTRAIVDRKIKGVFLQYLKEEAKRFVPGSPYDVHNNVGCVVSREQYEKINAWIAAAKEDGAEVFQTEGRTDGMMSGACCIQPAVITGIPNDARVAQNEIFGPVVVLLESGCFEESVQLANATCYGLAGAVFTDDMNEAYYAAQHMEAGIVHINCYGEDDNTVPFGGFRESGIGKDKSLWAFDEYSEQKTVWMKLDGLGGCAR